MGDVQAMIPYPRVVIPRVRRIAEPIGIRPDMIGRSRVNCWRSRRVRERSSCLTCNCSLALIKSNQSTHSSSSRTSHTLLNLYKAELSSFLNLILSEI